MSFALSFSLISLAYTILLLIIYFSKKRINSLETKIYSILVITNPIGLLVQSFIGLSYEFFDIDSEILRFILIKLLLLYFIAWMSIFTTYIHLITHDSKEYKISKLAYLYPIVGITLMLILPMYMGDGRYSYGPACYETYIYSGICITYMIVWTVLGIKKTNLKKAIPLFLFMILGTVVMVIQLLLPDEQLLVSLQSFLTFIMYFTIENPDMKMIKELDAAKAAAEKANRAKSDFLSSMSHEIRTPLNAIVGFSDCILEETTLDAAMSDAKDIKLASQNLLEIVNGILDISKIEANKMEIVNTEYELKDTLMNIAKLVKPRIGDKPIELIENYSSDLPYKCYGDGGKLRQIVTNILTNAVKYTETGSIKYNVACINEGDTCKLCISVEDTGRGIKPEQIDKLFTKFQRLDEDKNTTLEGTGLGLAITKNLAEMMGGKVVVQSVYGQGSKFTVYLSQKIVELVHTEESLMNDINKMNKMNSTVDFSTKKVLVVDDNKINIKVALKLLSQYGITADSAESGQEAIDKIKASTYDLVMLDDMMPHMSGVETLHNLKTIPTYATPTVALTANALTGMKEKYLNDGFTDYLAKPIEKPELERVLNEYLK